jgi:hypothetical protein
VVVRIHQAQALVEPLLAAVLTLLVAQVALQMLAGPLLVVQGVAVSTEPQVV